MTNEIKKPWLKFYEDGVQKELSIPEIGLLDMFKKTVERFPERPALIFEGRTWSYQQMDLAVERLARAFAKNGLNAGDRISIYMPNSANWVIGFFAIMRLGAVVVQTNPLYVENELRYQLLDAGATGIVSIPPLLPRILAVKDETKLKIAAIDALKAYGGQESPFILDLNDMLNDSSFDLLDLPQPQVQSNTTVAVLQYTGGTTGVSKGVMLTHHNLVANAMQAWEWILGKEGEERVLTVLPLFHIYALTACQNLAMLSGGAMVILSKFDINAVLQHINDYEPTFFPGAPTMYVAVINHPRIQEYKVSSIRICLSGSAPLPKEVALRFGELTGGRLVEAYGLSEASPATHLNPVYHARVGSIGVPAPNTEARIVDLTTGEITLEPGEIGELAIKGEQIMLGYWQKPNETQAVLRDGWLYTGDIARMDEDGFFYIVDRKKDMIITGGYNVYPRDIEEVLYQHPAVKEAVCAGIPDKYWGEMVKAYVVLKTDNNVSEQELIAFCHDKLASYKIPKKIEIREMLPRTAVGKVLRRFLIEEEVAAAKNVQ
ncbi:MAG: long-chain-fatty-acid--CoA ligase [Desulfitobacteriaceae bacterium]